MTPELFLSTIEEILRLRESRAGVSALLVQKAIELVSRGFRNHGAPLIRHGGDFPLELAWVKGDHSASILVSQDGQMEAQVRQGGATFEGKGAAGERLVLDFLSK